MSKSAYPELIETLSNFKTTSFTQLQAAAYIALLQLGEESGSATAKASGINRSKIYDILNQLEEIGAVNKVSREGKTRYIAVSPDKLFPEILSRFESDIKKSQEALNTIKNLEQEVDPSKFTITRLAFDDLDVNQFQYLISSTERSRTQFIEQVPKELRPDKHVKILNLNDQKASRGLILLISDEEAYIFGTPIGQVVDAIHIMSSAICEFMIGIIENHWTKDLPLQVMEEIKIGQRNALYVGKALQMEYEMLNKQKFVHNRPVSFLLTDEHISFFYLGEEDPKIPIISLNNVVLNPEDNIKLEFTNKDGEIIGELRMSTVNPPIFLKNILSTVAPKLKSRN